ncbi:MAG: hypothetical protein KAT04_03490 [Methylococcales bacterium]|nr:hypothetical protein [Methylococcales bacterium]
MSFIRLQYFAYLVFLFLILYSFSPLYANQSALKTPLFQNKFFTLSTDSALICSTNENNFLSSAELSHIISFYQNNNPIKLQQYAVAVLTDHSNADHLEDLLDYKDNCHQSTSPDLCLLEHYWGNKEAALRALALFYDTKTIIKHGENYQARRFTIDHLRVFEKAIRKIPAFMRKTISKAKPIKNLDHVIKDLDDDVQTLIQDAFPKDFATSIWSDDTHPLTFVPGIGFKSQVVAQVYNGQNLIIFTVKAFDKAKDGKLYRDINLKYLVDFRIPIIVHEIAHTVDNFHFWNGSDELYYFYRYRKISNDNETVKLITNAKLALWPSKWFEAFEYLWGVNEGRYNGETQEKLAELVAQYILIPERLKQSTPQAYAWLRDIVFKKVEYSGYDTCSSPIIRPLNWWEHSIAKILGI